MNIFSRRKRTRKERKVVVKRDHHNISRKNIDPDALKVLYRLSRSGYTACLAGGAVRDLLIGRTPKDFDISTSAHPNEIKRLFRNCFLVGRRFRLVHIRFGTKVIECSTFRKKPEPVDATNDEEGSLYQHHDNAFGTAEEDAKRRDFTVNGLLYDIRGFDLVDYVGGLEDLKKKVIRTIGDPNVRFQEDPVRMLRAIRFAARLGFKIEKSTWKAILKHHGEIAKSSPARLMDEILKLFTQRSGHDAVRLLRESGLMKDLLPWVDKYLASSNDKGALFWKCLKALDASEHAGENPPAALVFSAMCYPMFMEELYRASKEGQRLNSMAAAQAVLTDNDGRPRIIRADFYQVVNILAMQHRFETWKGGRFSKPRFVRRRDFPAAAAFYEIQSAARGLAKPGSRPWMELYKQCGENEGASGELPLKPKVRRPRRRGGRRRRR